MVLDAAREAGAAPSVFLGRKRRSVTDYIYDTQGQLTRSVTTHDPEWTAWDRAVALAVAEERALLCDGCGKPRDETMADENLGPVPDYHAEAWRCRACHAKDALAGQMAGSEQANPMAGLYFAVSRNGTSG